jgi:hypothetical protein
MDEIFHRHVDFVLLNKLALSTCKMGRSHSLMRPKFPCIRIISPILFDLAKFN